MFQEWMWNTTFLGRHLLRLLSLLLFLEENQQAPMPTAQVYDKDWYCATHQKLHQVPVTREVEWGYQLYRYLLLLFLSDFIKHWIPSEYGLSHQSHDLLRPHHLGAWPICDLPSKKQEQMPVEDPIDRPWSTPVRPWYSHLCFKCVKAGLEPVVLPVIPKPPLVCSNSSLPKVLFLEPKVLFLLPLRKHPLRPNAFLRAFLKQVVCQKVVSLVIPTRWKLFYWPNR